MDNRYDISQLLDVLRNNRQSGSTTTLFEGINNSPNALFIGTDRRLCDYVLENIRIKGIVNSITKLTERI